MIAKSRMFGTPALKDDKTNIRRQLRKIRRDHNILQVFNQPLLHEIRSTKASGGGGREGL